MPITFQTVKTMFGLLKLAPAVQSGLRRWKGRPTVAERALLAEWARRLDERRVFFADYDIEVVESCLASLEHVRTFTDETLAKVEHAGARAVLGAILDLVRQIGDKWHGFQTPRFGDWPDRFPRRHPGDRTEPRPSRPAHHQLGAGDQRPNSRWSNGLRHGRRRRGVLDRVRSANAVRRIRHPFQAEVRLRRRNRASRRILAGGSLDGVCEEVAPNR